MGLFGKAKRELGIADKKLIATGVLARGNIVSVTPGGVTIGDDSNLQYGPEKVTTSKSTYTAAEILQQGSACTVDVLAVIPLNHFASDGRRATGLVLRVHRDGMPGYRAQIGTHIPDSAVAKVVVGATLPARWVPGQGLPTDVNLVTPDWPAIAA
jgi:hypothetical protein